MLPSTSTVNGALVFDVNEAIFIEKLLITVDESKRPVKIENIEILVNLVAN